MTKEIILYYIKEKGIAEFVKGGFSEKYREQIEAWFIYLDQVEFGIKLEKRMFEEIDRYMASKKTIDEILVELFEEPEWIIEIEEGLIEKYQELRTMKNLILSYA